MNSNKQLKQLMKRPDGGHGGPRGNYRSTHPMSDINVVHALSHMYTHGLPNTNPSDHPSLSGRPWVPRDWNKQPQQLPPARKGIPQQLPQGTPSNYPYDMNLMHQLGKQTMQNLHAMNNPQPKPMVSPLVSH